jgi:hypothetical protein
MIVGAALLLSAWGPKAPPAHIRSIGIIAALGDTCMFEQIPDTRFDWLLPPKAKFLEITDWGIDDEIIRSIDNLLGPHYKMQTIAIEHQDFDSWTYDSIGRHIRELPIPETPVDAYLLVLRDWRHDAIGGTNHQVGGLGFYRRDRDGHAGRFGVFASYRLVLVDADSGRLIASRPANIPHDRLPWLTTGASVWPRTPNDLTPAGKTELLADFNRLIAETLPTTLGSLGLVTRDRRGHMDTSTGK